MNTIWTVGTANFEGVHAKISMGYHKIELLVMQITSLMSHNTLCKTREISR